MHSDTLQINHSFNIEEISNLLLEPYGFNLLIKGPAGAGKTTLALEIMKTNPEAIFISTRITPKSLFSQFPWIEDFIKPENILDASQTYIPPETNMRNMNLHMKRLLYYKDIPDFLKIIYERTAEIQNPLIIIDSWNAIIELNNENSKQKSNQVQSEHIFVEFMRQINAKIILISEENRVKLDYLVDGVISLNHNIKSGRIRRELRISKLRGQEIKNPIREYSLFNGRFRALDIFNFDIRDVVAENFHPKSDRNGCKLISGIPNFDALLNNGKILGQTTLIERQGTIEDENLQVFISPLIINHLYKGGRCIILTPVNYSVNSYYAALEKIFPMNQLKSRIFIINFDENNEIFAEDDIFDNKHKKLNAFFQYLQNESFFFEDSKENNPPVMFVIHLDTIEYKFNGIKFADILGKFISYIKSTGKIVFFISNENLDVTGDIKILANKHIVFHKENSSLKIYSVKPWSPYYGLILNQNHNLIDLIKIT